MENQRQAQVAEDLILGLDIGIGSVGWAIVRELPCDEPVYEILATDKSNGGRIFSLGARCMSVPENPKTKELLNHKRRDLRGQRRVIERRAQRMRSVRFLLAENLFSGVRDVQSFHQPEGGKAQFDPWGLRVEGLNRVLTDAEFASALLHMCKHRGFKSNSKKDSSDKDTGKMLVATRALAKKIKEDGKRTIAELLVTADKKRNRSGWDGKPDYSHTLLRTLVQEETEILFAAQRSFGNVKATSDLEKDFIEKAFTQRPLKSVAGMVGNCVFIDTEKRAPRFAPTAETFRLAQRLTTMRLHDIKGPTRALSKEEIRLLLGRLGAQKGLTYKAVRKFLGLVPGTTFAEIGKKGPEDKKDPEDQDIVGKSNPCAPGSYIFCQVLGRESYLRLRDLALETGNKCLDVITKIISDNDDISFIQKEMNCLPIADEEKTKVYEALDKGEFANFKGYLNISLQAMELILPHMIDEGDYSRGCELAGFDHSKTRSVDLKGIRNPVVSRIIAETRKQVRAIIREFGVVPGKVHIELLRDVGKSTEERNEISKGIADRTEKKKQLKQELAGHFNCPYDRITADELRRYELWKLQKHKCAYYALFSKCGGDRFYTGEFINGGIPVEMLRDSEHAVQIDHILPMSRTSDNSFHNQCLCINAANQRKGNNTPYEWLGKDYPEGWHTFEEWVRATFTSGFKKRNFLMENLDQDKEERFHARNLIDSSYAARLVAHALEEEFRDKELYNVSFTHENGNPKRRFFARPGAVTATLRQHWGVNSLKYDAEHRRIGDKHHALDALVIACCTEGLLQRVTKFHQDKKDERKCDFPRPKLLIPSDTPITLLQQKSTPVFASDKSPEEVLEDAKEAQLKDFMHGAEKLISTVFVSRSERGKTKGALHEETLRSIRTEINDKGKEIEVLYERKPIAGLSAKDLEKIKDPHRCKDIVNALKEWIDQGKPKEHDKLPKSHKGDVIRRVQLKRGLFSSGIKVKRGDSVAQANNGEMVRTDVFTKGNKFYLVPVYTWQLAAGIVPDRAIVGAKDEKDWKVMDESYEFLFSLFKKSYVVLQKRNGELFAGYFDGTNRATASITLAAHNDSEDRKSSLGVLNLERFEKYKIDRFGRLYRIEKEKRP